MDLVQDERSLEQRIAAEVTRRVELFDELLEGPLGVTERACYDFARAGYTEPRPLWRSVERGQHCVNNKGLFIILERRLDKGWDTSGLASRS